MTWRLIVHALAALLFVGGCANPLAFRQKIDAPRYVLPCTCGEAPCSD